jgi:hypothetical protein
MQFVAPPVEILLGFVLDFYELILLDELIVFVALSPSNSIFWPPFYSSTL